MTSGKGKVVFALFACLALGASLLLIAYMPLDSDRWEDVRNRTAKLKLEAMSRKMPREVFRGKPIPGNAWEEYNVALTAPWPEDAGNGGMLFPFAAGKLDEASNKRYEEIVKEQLPLLEHLRLGAQRSNGQYPYKWEFGEEYPSQLRSRMLANLAIAQASILTKDGKPQEAADLLLDATVFARDSSTIGPLLSSAVGLAIYSTVFEGFRNLIASGKLTQEQYADLARKLEAVERDLPPVNATLSNELLSIGLGVLLRSTGEYNEGWQSRAKEGGWRYVAFPQKTILEAFEQSEALMQRYENVDPTNFAAAKREIDAISVEAQKSPNPIVRESIPGLARVTVSRREALTTLRLLRAGMMFRATGNVPTIADPFGMNLFFKQEAGSLKIWSIGPDGKNDNGKGEWLDIKPDMVLEIPR